MRVNLANKKREMKERFNKSKIGKFLTPRRIRQLKIAAIVILFLIVIAVLIWAGVTGKFSSKFTPIRDTLLSKEALKSSDTILDKKIYKLKIKDNKGSGLTLEHGGLNSKDSVKAYPNNTSGAKVWVYNPNDYSLCSSVDGLCLYNKSNDKSVVIKSHQKNNNDFKWNINFDNQTIAKKDTNLVIDNNKYNDVSISDLKDLNLTQHWNFEIQD